MELEPELQPKSISLENIQSPTCPVCSKVLSTLYNVRLHVKKLHPDFVDDTISGNSADGQRSKNFQCSICSELFTSINYLRKHISKIHQTKEDLSDDQVNSEPEQIQNTIEISDNTQTENVDLNMSIDSEKKSTTTKDKIHQCTICFKVFKENYNLRRHMNSKTVHLKLDGEQKEIDNIVGSTCLKCDRTFSNKHNLRRHILKNVCSRKKKVKQDLTETLVPALTKDTSTVTESPRIQPVEPWRQREMVCKICNFKTYYADNYYLHRKTPKHLEKQRFRKMQKERFTRRFFRRLKKLAGLRFRQFRCFKCKVNSMYKSVIVFHRNYRHKRMKPFPCSLCTMSFFLSRKLERHMVKVHTALKPKRCFVNKCKRTFISNDLYGKHLSCVHKTEVSIKENDIKEEDDDDIVEVEIVNLVKIPSTVPFVIHRTSSKERSCRFCKVTCFNEVALINHLLRHRQILTANAKRTKGRTKNSKLKALAELSFKCSATNSN